MQAGGAGFWLSPMDVCLGPWEAFACSDGIMGGVDTRWLVGVPPRGRRALMFAVVSQAGHGAADPLQGPVPHNERSHGHASV